MYGHPDSNKANETAKQVLEILKSKAATPPMDSGEDAPLMVDWAITWDPGKEMDGVEPEPQWWIRARVALPQTFMAIVPFDEEAFEGSMEPEHIARNTMAIVMGELSDLYEDLGRVMQAVQEWTTS